MDYGNLALHFASHALRNAQCLIDCKDGTPSPPSSPVPPQADFQNGRGRINAEGGGGGREVKKFGRWEDAKRIKNWIPDRVRNDRDRGKDGRWEVKKLRGCEKDKKLDSRSSLE